MIPVAGDVASDRRDRGGSLSPQWNWVRVQRRIDRWLYNAFFLGRDLRRCTCRSKSAKCLLVIFLASVVTFGFVCLLPGLSCSCAKSEDEVTTLRAQVGYLKRKFAQTTGSVVDVNDRSMPTVFVITPTYRRLEQKAELTRLCNVFLLVPNLHWILVEDAANKSDLATKFLARCGVKYTHLNRPTPEEDKTTPTEAKWRKHRGVHQRNEALFWLRDNMRGDEEGVIYFADDDNTYTTEIFDEMRYTEKVSVWPVAMVGGLYVEKPILDWDPQNPDKKVVRKWDVMWSPGRKFAVDMAGFSVNLGLFLRKKKAKFSTLSKIGHTESDFLQFLVDGLQDLEPKADGCTRVLVWHTKTKQYNPFLEDKRKSLLLEPSNHNMEI